MKRKEKNQRPHRVFVVEGKGDHACWTEMGAAWIHENAKGFNITLKALPLRGRLVVREPKAEESTGR